ncbi:ankyrin repeat domain-containing protein [Marinobacter halodurans]|uniref:Ankyrin repeat domain-containing protein n=1 Tax=Marinobacter halodurans TaxID=2528979 RepID=A0ABY1ZCZ2_9GAMM|nr:ankyrin repeat domain-containing protein [Marinobacter halodurans]TBW43303.1 ankyrin repeat domain-containing protein [Marinobacter halodurans]
MNDSVRDLLDQVESVPDFAGVKLRDINDTNGFGDNALHCVCVWGDIEAVKLLVENGINVEQRGEGGLTPLKVADEFGHKEIVSYLIAKGANPEALDAEFQYDSEAHSRHLAKVSVHSTT